MKVYKRYNRNIRSHEWKTSEGLLHREDGPAQEGDENFWGVDRYRWFWYDIPLSFSDWCFHTGKSDDEILMLKLRYGVSNDC